MSPAARVVVDLVVALGLVVLLPLGLRLLGGVPRLRWWPVVGAAGAASLALPRGPVAVALAALYAAATLVLLGLGVRRAARWCRTRRAGPAPTTAVHELAALTALGTPLAGATALVAERAGTELFGFSLGILALTVPHLHVAGFAAALVAGLVGRLVQDGAAGRRAQVAAATVPAGTLLVLVGYFLGDAAELVGAVVLTAGMWLVAHLVWTRVLPAVRTGGLGAGRGRAVERLAAPLLGTSALVLVVTMALALVWAVGEATGWPHPSLSWMVATHGLANALGFGLCGLVGWRLVAGERVL
ncbi:YndJ family protein [Cellulomonas endophytica]|uniref:YndJ family protein n=1 Tax=Cellulomonas endophytica TaxID=2494735 RepID=UPI001F0C69C9|nr:YndJ family protein [Cellulomonas endophytica]